VTRSIVVTTSYPRVHGDAEGHFVSAEVRRLCERGEVTVVAPGSARSSLWGERIVGLGGDDAFGFPGVLARLREQRARVVPATQFVWRATRWLHRESLAPRDGAPTRVVAHFVLPCGVPIATRGLAPGVAELEVVCHGSDARLWARLPGRSLIARDLLRSGARLRFVSAELRDRVLTSLPERERAQLAAKTRVEPSPCDVEGVPTKTEARSALGIAPQTKLAVVVARLIASKRVDVALEACRRIPHLEVIVLGDGPERAPLTARFPLVRFIGQVDRPTALTHLAAADALVSASLEEGAPTAIREARALGTPVICLAAGDLLTWAQSDPGLVVID
jgi:glycosyltransferase involved in cell wall biosynthesis